MSAADGAIDIRSRDFWFKVVEMLQQNWALIDSASDGATLWFISDTGGVFDEMEFGSANDAESALIRNGFRRLAEDAKAKEFIRPPSSPFVRRSHPNGRIYSTGRFWK